MSGKRIDFVLNFVLRAENFQYVDTSPVYVSKENAKLLND